jgi:hypothetical protein
MAVVLQEVEKKYEKQTLEKEYLAYRKVMFYRIFIGSICLLAIISLLIVQIRKRRQRNIDLQADIEILTSQMGEFDDLRIKLLTLLDERIEKEAKLQQVLTNRILHFQKIVDYLYRYGPTPIKFKEKVSEAVLQVEKGNYFGELHDLVNERYAGVINYLKRKYSTLTDEELDMCSLICFGFNNSHIGVLFGHTNPRSVFGKRYNLRKKLGLLQNNDTLEAYLSKVISDLQDRVPVGE